MDTNEFKTINHYWYVFIIKLLRWIAIIITIAANTYNSYVCYEYMHFLLHIHQSKKSALLELSIENILTIDMVTLMGCNCIENILKIDLVAFIDCQNMTCLKCTITSYV